MRSTHNVGSLLRTAECLGVQKVILSGYTPYPRTPDDGRLPHIADKLSAQIHKTALGAEDLVPWEHVSDVTTELRELKAKEYAIAALEQSPRSTVISSWTPPDKIAVLLGREVEGVAPELLAFCDTILEIPQFGHKESLNVVQAAAIALYQAQFAPFV